MNQISFNPPIGTTSDLSIRSTTQRDEGYTLMELILVVLILGVLASVVIFAVSDVRADAAESGCGMDDRTLGSAAEAYFAQNGSTAIPATGTDDDRFERTLVDGGYLRAISDYYDLDANGAAAAESDSPC